MTKGLSKPLAGNIRVYELARELGLTNKETLDLCVALGIGVKSHSSSVVEPQADRVRRKAEREGLVRDVQPEEPEKDKKPARGKKKADEAPAEVPAPAAEAPAPAPTPPAPAARGVGDPPPAPGREARGAPAAEGPAGSPAPAP